jgi:chromate transporter
VVPFAQAVRAWFLISLQTFGGPAGQIAVMQRELVEERRWIGQRRFLHALSFCTLLPGPEAQQLAVYVGWLLNGVRGGLVAGILFVLPGVAALLALSALYVGYGDTTAVTALFAGLAGRAGGRRAGRGAGGQEGARASGPGRRRSRRLRGARRVLGAVPGRGGRRRRPRLAAGPAGTGGDVHGRGHQDDDGPAPLVPDDALHRERPNAGHAARVLLVGVLVWGLPLGLVAWLTGPHSVVTDQGLFFSGAALVTFGGAYAVLAYVAQKAVEVYGWLAPGEMVHGLALAESTPGPLIMVVQFVAFVGAYRDPGSLDPWAAALLGRC